jgi:hypothetical protein
MHTAMLLYWRFNTTTTVLSRGVVEQGEFDQECAFTCAPGTTMLTLEPSLQSVIAVCSHNIVLSRQF